MQTRRQRSVTARRNFLLQGMTLAGAAVFAGVRRSGAAEPAKGPESAQAAPSTATTAPASSISVRSVDRVAGSPISYAYALKAGNWVFLMGTKPTTSSAGPRRRWKDRREIH